jgi:hypothetical protein
LTPTGPLDGGEAEDSGYEEFAQRKFFRGEEPPLLGDVESEDDFRSKVQLETSIAEVELAPKPQFTSRAPHLVV